ADRRQHALVRVEADDVAVADPGQHTAGQGLGADVDGGRGLARGARHAAVGDEGDLEALVLQHAERRRQAVQFRHAVGPGALEAEDDDHVAVQPALLEGLQGVLLGFEYGGGGLDDAILRLDRRDLDDGAAEIALDEAQAALAVEGIGGGAENVRVQTVGDAVAPDQLALDQRRLLEIVVDAGAHDGLDVGVY